VPPFALDRALGVVKAYTTRVGGGPFPTELDNDVGEQLRQAGGEFGTTTGRPRRCGWFDAVAVRHAARLGGVREAVLTKLDVLDAQPVLRVATGYRLDGADLPSFGAAAGQLEKVEPVYEELPGWQQATSDCRTFEDLPEAARRYVRRLEELTGLRFSSVSVGQGRGQSVRREQPGR
jgi:adenylosuccinate synthase